MKIRNGFVSNSSSSSYVLAYKKGNKCEHCGRSDPDLSSMFTTSGSYDETRVLAGDYKEIIAKLKENYEDEISYCKDDDEGDVEYKQEMLTSFMSESSKVSKWHEKGYSLVWVRVSYSDSEMFNSILAATNAQKVLNWG